VSQLLRVHLALEDEGISLLDPFIYRLERSGDLLYLVSGLRWYAHFWLDWSGDWLTNFLHLASRAKDYAFLARRSANPIQFAQDSYAVRPDGHPFLPILAEMIDSLRAKNVTVIVYVSPINMDRLRELGVETALHIEHRLEYVRNTLNLTASEWVDLHDLLPLDAFYDDLNHMLPEGCRAISQALVSLTKSRLRSDTDYRVSDHGSQP
jgi:hypothetical protein